MRVTSLVLIALMVAGSSFAEEPAAKKKPKKSRIQEFKEKVRYAETATDWLLVEHNAEVIDLLAPQHEDLVRLQKKYMAKMFKAEAEVKKTHEYFTEAHSSEECAIRDAINDAYHRALAKKQRPIERKWAREMERVLTREQIARMNEIMVRAQGILPLYQDPDIQRLLRLTQEQKAALKEIWGWAVVIKYDVVGGVWVASREDTREAATKYRIMADAKALRVLTEQQRKDFFKLAGVKDMKPGEVPMPFLP